MSRFSRSRISLTALAARVGAKTASRLRHIAEVDVNEFYVPAGYPSLHAYCVGAMGLSEDLASKLIQRARDGVATGQIPRPVPLPSLGMVATEPRPVSEQVERLPDGRFLWRFNVDRDTYDRLRYVQWLLSDESHTADIDEVMGTVLKCAHQALIESREQDEAGIDRASGDETGIGGCRDE